MYKYQGILDNPRGGYILLGKNGSGVFDEAIDIASKVINGKGKLLDNGMVNVPISLEDESIDMVIYSKTVMAIVQKNKLPNPQSYAESFASLIGKTVSIKGSLKTFNGKRQLVYNK